MEHNLPDWNFEEIFHVSTQTKPIRPEDELVELLWRDGQVVLHSQTQREPIQPPTQHHLVTSNDLSSRAAAADAFLQDQETVSWIQYPPFDDDDELSSSHFFSSSIPQLCPERQSAGDLGEGTGERDKGLDDPPPLITMPPPKLRTVSDTKLKGNGGGNCVSMSDRIDDRNAAATSSSSGCSFGRTSKESAGGIIGSDRKRKQMMEAEESVSQTDATGNRSSQRSGSTRRSRAAEVHNLSERRRRDRINERMKALQELIPHCNKTDKASILDEAIDYLKSLQLQLQVMWMGNGMATTPMMFQGLQQPYLPHMGIQMASSFQSPMQFPQIPVIDRSTSHNSGLVCQNPVQYQNQAFSEQLARYIAGFPQMQAASQNMNMLRYGSQMGQQSQVSAPTTTENLPANQ